MPPLFANNLNSLAQLQMGRQGMADSRLFNSLAANRATNQQNLMGRQMANSDAFRLAGLMAGARDSQASRAARAQAAQMQEMAGRRTESGLNQRARLNAMANLMSAQIGNQGRLATTKAVEDRNQRARLMSGMENFVEMGGAPEKFIAAAGPDMFPENAAPIGNAIFDTLQRGEALKNERATALAEAANTELGRVNAAIDAIEKLDDKTLMSDYDNKMLGSLAADHFITPPDGLSMATTAEDKRQAFRDLRATVVDRYESKYPGQITFQKEDKGGGGFSAIQWKKFSPEDRRSPIDTAREKAKEIAPPQDQGTARREAMGMTEEQVRYMANRKLGMTTDPAKIQAIIERAKLLGVDMGVN